MIYASLHPETCGGGQLFNVADNEMPSKNGEIWPQLAAWFGLKGVGPAKDTGVNGRALGVGELPHTASQLTPGKYVVKHKGIFEQCRRSKALEGGVGAGSQQLDSVGYWLTFDRQLSLKKLRATGFEGDKDAIGGWLDSFEMFRKAGLII
jgi:hypothetical protein